MANAFALPWFRQFRFEWGHLLRSKLLMSLPVLFGVWFAYILWNIPAGVSQDIHMYSYEFHRLQHTFSLGVAMFLGMQMLRRDLMKPSFEWVGCLPVSSSVFYTAKYAAGFLYLSLFTGSMAAVFAYFGRARELSADVLAAHLAEFTHQYTWSYGITLALGMLLAIAIPNRIAYMIGFCAWMFGTFFMDVFIIQRQELYMLKTFHLSQFFLTSLQESEVFAPGLAGRELRLSRLFVAAFILLLGTAGITLLKRYRPSAASRRWRGFSLAAFMLAAGVFLPYAGYWQDKYAAYASRLAITPVGVIDEQSYSMEGRRALAFPVHAIDIRLARVGRTRLEAEATVRLPVPGPEYPRDGRLAFTLNRDFTLSRLELNGRPILWERENDRIWFDAALLGAESKGEQVLRFAYGGTPQAWQPVKDDREIVQMFVEGDSLYLPDNLAWYPLPGAQNLYLNRRRTDGDELLILPNIGLNGTADIRLAVEGIGRKVYATIQAAHSGPDEPGAGGRGAAQQFFEQEQATGVTLFAGRLIEVAVPEVETSIVTGPSNKKEAERFLGSYADVIRYYQSWLEAPMPEFHQIHYYPTAQVNYWTGFEIGGIENGFLKVDEQKHRNLDGFQLGDVVHAALFGDRRLGYRYSYMEPPADSYVEEIREAFYRLYFAEHAGLARPSDSRIYNGELLMPRFTISDQDRTTVGQDVERALQEKRFDELKRVLNVFYRRGLMISNEAPSDGYPIITEEEWRAVWDSVFKPRQQEGVRGYD